MDDDATTSEHDDVKEGLLIEGLQDWIHLSEMTHESLPSTTTLPNVRWPKPNS